MTASGPQVTHAGHHLTPRRAQLDRSLTTALLRLRDRNEQERNDREQGRGHIDGHHRRHRQRGNQQRTHRCRDDHRPALQGLIQALDACQVSGRHHQRCRCHHGGPVEGSAERAKEECSQNRACRRGTRQEQQGQQTRRGSDRGVSDEHDPPAVPAIHEGTDEWSQHDLRQDSDQRRSGQDRGGTCPRGQPPDQGELHRLTSQQRQGLASPDHEKWAETSVDVRISAHNSSFLSDL